MGLKGCWTPNFETDADRSAPLLAKQGGAAAALYFLLHSRVFATGNRIGMSVQQLAFMLKSDRRTIQRAIRSLEDAGLIASESHPGNGGGSTFRLLGLTRLGDGADASYKAASMSRIRPSDATTTPPLPWQTRRITNSGERCITDE